METVRDPTGTSDADSVIGVYLTFPDVATAEAVAGVLLEGGHAACVNVFAPGISVYRWAGRVQRETEVVAWAKSTLARLPALTAAVEGAHPYDVPCVVAYPAVGGAAAYLAWVTAEVGERPPGSSNG
jgi:periplasmic divalent cation tolerance protein